MNVGSIVHNGYRMTSAELAELIAQAAVDKKARDVVTIDLRNKTTLTDFFVVCEGDTDRQVRAIVENVTDTCKKNGVRALSVIGMDDATWACADLDSVILHVLLPGERSFYDLEGLWEGMPQNEDLTAQG